MVVITSPTFCSSLFGMGIERQAKGFRARVKKGTRTFNGPVRDTKEEAAADERQYQEAAAESAEMETVHENLHRPRDLLDQRGNSWRARVMKNGQQFVGPYRSSKSEAEADVKQFMKAGRVSADAVASVSQELREAELGERQFQNFDTVMQSHIADLVIAAGICQQWPIEDVAKALATNEAEGRLCCCLGCVQAFGCGL